MIKIKNTVLSLVAVALFGGFIAGPSAQAGKLFKWVDETGRTHYGDSVPPRYAKQERNVLNKQGRVVETFEREKTKEEIARDRQQRDFEEQRRLAAEQQARDDKILLDLYQSVADIERARQSKISTIDGFVRVNQGNIDRHKLELDALIKEAAGYERQGKKVPANLQSDIGNVRSQIDRNQKAISTRNDEKSKINREFDAKINRFKELRGIKD
jgi:hypothetical protein